MCALKKAVAYARISTDEDRQKYSLSVQKELLYSWAANNDYEIVNFYSEECSAKTANRPEFQKSLEYCKRVKNIDSFLVVDYYRYSRSIEESYKYKAIFSKIGVQIIAIQQPIDISVPESVMIEAMYFAAPEMENRRRSINVIKGMRKKLQDGHIMQLPVGYWKDKNTGKVHLSDDARYIKKAYDMVLSGEKLPTVSAELSKLGFLKSPKALDKILKNITYAGKIKNALLDDLVQGNHPALVTIDEYDRVVYLIEGRGNFKAPTTEEDKLYLKGYVKCCNCGKSLTGYYVKSKQKKANPKEYRQKKTQVPYYKCNTRGCGVNVNANKMHSQLEDVLQSFMVSPDFVDDLRIVLVQVFNEKNKDLLEQRKRLESDLTIHQKRLKSLELKFIDDLIDADTYKDSRVEFMRNIQSIMIELENMPEDLSNPNLFVDYSLKLLSNINTIWKIADNSRKLLLLNTLFPKGLSYSKEESRYRTPSVNSLFVLITSISENYKTKKGYQINNNLLITESSPMGIIIEPILFNNLQVLLETIA